LLRITESGFQDILRGELPIRSEFCGEFPLQSLLLGSKGCIGSESIQAFRSFVRPGRCRGNQISGDPLHGDGRWRVRPAHWTLHEVPCWRSDVSLCRARAYWSGTCQLRGIETFSHHDLGSLSVAHGRNVIGGTDAGVWRRDGHGGKGLRLGQRRGGKHYLQSGGQTDAPFNAGKS
jgi:hypothetical protein